MFNQSVNTGRRSQSAQNGADANCFASICLPSFVAGRRYTAALTWMEMLLWRRSKSSPFRHGLDKLCTVDGSRALPSRHSFPRTVEHRTRIAIADWQQSLCVTTPQSLRLGFRDEADFFYAGLLGRCHCLRDALVAHILVAANVQLRLRHSG